MTARTDLAFAIVPVWMIEGEASDGAVRLYAALSQQADNDTGQCWPGRQTLADRLRCSLATIDRRLAELEAMGALAIERRFGPDGSPTSNLYTVHRLPPGSRADAATPGRADEGRVAAQTRPDLDQGDLDQETPPCPASPNVATGSAGAVAREALGLSWTPSDVSARHGSLPDALRLCALLAEQLRARGVRVPEGRERTRTWVDPMEALLRLDERPPEAVERVMAWLAAGNDRVSHFWQANVLSPTKLRERWDQMAQQYVRERSPRPGRGAAITNSAGSGRSLADILSDDDQPRALEG